MGIRPIWAEKSNWGKKRIRAFYVRERRKGEKRRRGRGRRRRRRRRRRRKRKKGLHIGTDISFPSYLRFKSDPIMSLGLGLGCLSVSSHNENLL